MELTVKLFATFRSGRFDVQRADWPAGTSLADIVGRLGIAEREIGVLMVNGRHADLGDRPAAGATVAIFPLVGGG